MKTFSAKASDVERSWHVVDLSGKTVGRVATTIATVLRGKNKPIYTPHVDTGDYVIAINADKVVFSGNKFAQKKYYRHSGWPGGIRERTAEKQLETKPEQIILSAVRGMLPKGPLGRKMFKKFKVYAGAEHPHAAQQPQPLDA
jgi:large subunit ribosomal protein L13